MLIKGPSTVKVRQSKYSVQCCHVSAFYHYEDPTNKKVWKLFEVPLY